MMRTFSTRLQQFVRRSRSRSITAGLLTIIVVVLSGFTIAAGVIDPSSVVKFARGPAEALVPTAAVPGPALNAAAADRLRPPGLESPGKKPPAGWLYVVDSNRSMDEAQVLLLDPQSQAIQGAFRTGHAPDIALAPDGSRLYVASSHGSSSSLEVFDTVSGAILQTVEVPYRGVLPDLLLVSGMAISPDGRWLYIYKMQTIAPGNDQFMIAVFDTAAGQFRSTDIQVPDCQQALFVPAHDTMYILCRPSNNLRAITNGTMTIASTIALPVTPQAQNRDTTEYAVGGVASADGRFLYIATNTGRIWRINGNSSQITRTFDLALLTDTRAALESLSISPDGATLYIGIGPRESQTGLVLADRIATIDTATGKQVGTITPRQSLRNITISADGRYLFAIDRNRQDLLVISTNVGAPIRFVAVAP